MPRDQQCHGCDVGSASLPNIPSCYDDTNVLTASIDPLQQLTCFTSAARYQAWGAVPLRPVVSWPVSAGKMPVERQPNYYAPTATLPSCLGTWPHEAAKEVHDGSLQIHIRARAWMVSLPGLV